MEGGNAGLVVDLETATGNAGAALDNGHRTACEGTLLIRESRKLKRLNLQGQAAVVSALFDLHLAHQIDLLAILADQATLSRYADRWGAIVLNAGKRDIRGVVVRKMFHPGRRERIL